MTATVTTQPAEVAREWGHVRCRPALLVGLTCRSRAALSLGWLLSIDDSRAEAPNRDHKRRGARVQSTQPRCRPCRLQDGVS